MPLDGNIQDAVSSPAPDLDDAIIGQNDEVSASSSDDAAPAGSSAATDDAPQSILSVVRDVVAKGKAEQAPASSADPQENDGQSADAPASKEQDDENYSDVPFNKHPRFRKLLDERNTYKVSHEKFEQTQRFLTEHGLSADEAASMLTVASMRKRDPAGCWEAMRPWLMDLAVAAGVVLPPAMKQRVDAGELSAEAALELSRTTAQVQALKQQQILDQQRAEQERVQAQVNAIQRAAEDWEADRQQKDPNFSAKVQPMKEKLAYFQMTEGRPTDPEGVRDQLKRAYAAVNASLNFSTSEAARTLATAPRRPPVRPVMGGQVTAPASSEPKSVLDIVRAAGRRTAS